MGLTCLQGPACGDTYCRQIRRHPRYCKFYISGGVCSHGKKCSYTHVNFLNLIQELKSEVDNLKDAHRHSSEKTSKPKTKSQTPVQPSPEYPCTNCPKICLSSSGLKRHIKIKHAGEELLQNPVKSKPESKEETFEEPIKESQIPVKSKHDETMESKKEIIEETKEESQNPNPMSKAELALFVEQALRSAESKPPEVELDDNPRRKYLLDQTTNKIYIYDNLQRGEYLFTEDGGVSFTIFYSEFYGNIPQAELGLPSVNSEYSRYSNKVYYGNIEYLRSFPQETDLALQEQEERSVQPNLSAQLEAGHQQGGQRAVYGHHKHQGHKDPDEPGSEDPYQGHQQADDVQDTSGQDQLVVTSQDCSQEDFDIQNQKHTQQDSDPDQYHSDNSDIPDQDHTVHMGYRDQGQEDSDNSGQSDQDTSTDSENDDEYFSDI